MNLKAARGQLMMERMIRRSSAVRGFLSLTALAVVLGCSSEKEPGERIGKTEQALSTGLVISQVYGGGGNGSGVTAAPYQNDFVEIYNRGLTTVNTAGLSIQYASA